MALSDDFPHDHGRRRNVGIPPMQLLFNRFFIFKLAGVILIRALSPGADATPVEVHGGALILDLNADAFANGVATGYYEGFGRTKTPGQPHMVLARYFTSQDMVGRRLVGIGLRPDLNGTRPVVNVGTPSTPDWSVDIRQFRSLYDASPTVTTGLLFEVYNTAPSVIGLPHRQPQSTTFVIDSNGSWTSASGQIGFGGALSFLYSNDALLSYPNSGRYLATGDYSLEYLPSQRDPSVSGWTFLNNLMGTEAIFDTTDIVVTVVGSEVTITGKLVPSPEFLSYTALEPGIQVGTFRFSSIPRTAREVWRAANFGNSANSGSGADLADPNGNGIPNLMEYARYRHPTSSTNEPPGGLLQVSVNTSNKLEAAFSCARARSDLTLAVQASDSLSGGWTDLARSVNGAGFSVVAAGARVTEISVGDTRNVTVIDNVLVTDPLHNRRFMRLQVTAP